MRHTQKGSHLLKTELILSYVLRYGVILCSLIIGCGLLMRLGHIGSVHLSSREYIQTLTHGQILPDFSPSHTPSQFIEGIREFRPDRIIAIGLVLLITLPIARVGMTILIFLFEEDWPFFFITFIVFSVLISGILLGRAL